MYPRLLDLHSQIQKRSLFLFGPRATGKSTLLNLRFPEARFYDLLDNEIYSKLLKYPGLISEESTDDRIIVIDEIQKLPMLLDEAHRLISSKGRRFILTGSSARKLKRGAANLLAIRVKSGRKSKMASDFSAYFSRNRRF